MRRANTVAEVVKMKRLSFWSLGIVVALCASTTLAGVIHVPGDYSQINAAVQAAASGDTVLVAAGTFQDCTHESEGPGTTLTCVIMKSGVTLRGAGPEATIIDAQSLGRGIIAIDVANCRIENLQVTGAFAEVYGSAVLMKHVPNSVTMTDVRIAGNLDGGIICISEAHAVLTRVTAVGNLAKQGGGIAIEDTSNVHLIDCLIDDNIAPSGAGVFIRGGCQAVMEGCVVSNNTITADFGNGGGVAVQDANILMEDCDILANTTLGYGGGLVFTNNATGLISNCRIIGNAAASAYNEGGGIYSSQSPMVLRNVVIADNHASGAFAEGGGVAVSFTPSPTFENCTITGNSASGSEATGGVYAAFFTAPQFTNCIIANTTLGLGLNCVFDAAPVFTGCDVWGNSGGDALCGVDNGCNFSANPLFCTEPGMEYHIQNGSPCARGNHPNGGCGAVYCGAYPVGCTDVGVEDVPAGQRLVLGNAPNPFNPQTTIHFVLDAPGAAMIRIVDLRGHAVRTFRFEDLRANQRYEFNWNGADDAGLAMPSGVYLYQLDAGGVTTSKRMSLIR
jgi:hypothetical protein